MKLLFFVLILFSTTASYSQYHSDAEFLSQLGYMELSKNINCDSTSGTMIEIKICLNLEFQRIDSVMNENFMKMIEKINTDSLQNLLRTYQMAWIKNRKLQSGIFAKGYKHNMFHIVYLECMIESTRSRNTELLYLLNID